MTILSSIEFDRRMTAMCGNAEARHAGLSLELSKQVTEARALALLNQAKWCEAMDDINNGERLAITRAVMCGDALEAGRLLRDILQQKVLENATQDARDAFGDRHGIDPAVEVMP